MQEFVHHLTIPPYQYNDVHGSNHGGQPRYFCAAVAPNYASNEAKNADGEYQDDWSAHQTS